MAKSQKTSRGASPAYEDDKYSVRLAARSREDLGRLLSDRTYDVGHVHPQSKGEGVEATLYLTQREIDQLREEQREIEVGENLSAVGRKRQKEVGKGDRYDGGKIPPKGLGTKTPGPSRDPSQNKPKQ